MTSAKAFPLGPSVRTTSNALLGCFALKARALPFESAQKKKKKVKDANRTEDQTLTTEELGKIKPAGTAMDVVG